MLGQIDAGHADAERPRDIFRRPVFHDVKIEYLELTLIDPIPHAFQRLGEQVLLPGPVPFRAELRLRRVRDAFHDPRPLRFVSRKLPGPARSRRSCLENFTRSRAPPDLVLDAPAGQVEQPSLEPTHLRILDELGQPPRHADGGFLHNLFGLIGRQAGLLGEESNQTAICAAKVLPALRVVARLEPLQQAGPGFQGGVVVPLHDNGHFEG